MTWIPIASFLAGSLLSLLIPALLLIALVAWYRLVFRRVGAAETSELGRSGAEATAVEPPAAAEEAGRAGAEQPPPVP